MSYRRTKGRLPDDRTTPGSRRRSHPSVVMGRRAWAFEDLQEDDVSDPAPYLEVRDLTVRFETEDGTVRAVNG